MGRYVGRHRAPSRHTGRRVATVAALLTLPAAGVSPALADTPDWDPIIRCESGGDPTIENPVGTASGLFQFLDTTWAEFKAPGDPPRAKDASVAAQYAAADRQYAVSGFTAWEESRPCWGPLVGSHVVEPPAPIAAPPAVVSDSTVGRHAWTVVPGDNLSTIAFRNQISVAALYAANRDIVGNNPNLIFPGQVLTWA